MADYIGEIVMRSGDTLPLLAVAIEDDMGVPVNLTGASDVQIIVENHDGHDPRRSPVAPMRAVTPMVLPGLIIDASKGLVGYDWRPKDILRPGVIDLRVFVHLPTGTITAPTDRSARITVRPDVMKSVQGGLMPGRFDLALYRGDNYAWQFRLWQDDGRSVPVSLAGASVKAEIRNEPGGLYTVPMPTTVTLPNMVNMSLGAAATNRCPAEGSWDLQVTFEGGEVRTVLSGDVTTLGDVTDTGG